MNLTDLVASRYSLQKLSRLMPDLLVILRHVKLIEHETEYIFTDSSRECIGLTERVAYWRSKTYIRRDPKQTSILSVFTRNYSLTDSTKNKISLALSLSLAKAAARHQILEWKV